MGEGQQARRPKEMGAEHEGQWWMIQYEDATVEPEYLIGEELARKVYEQRQNSWNCRLFRQVTDALGRPVAALPEGSK